MVFVQTLHLAMDDDLLKIDVEFTDVSPYDSSSSRTFEVKGAFKYGKLNFCAPDSECTNKTKEIIEAKCSMSRAQPIPGVPKKTQQI